MLVVPNSMWKETYAERKHRISAQKMPAYEVFRSLLIFKFTIEFFSDCPNIKK